jgi:uncharacterized protein GlcG (DUF336 family)
MLETGFHSITRLTDDPLKANGTVGRCVSSMGLRIIDDDGNDVPYGEVGEIAAIGPSVPVGYLNNPQANRDSFTADNWFRTGDLGQFVDAEGDVGIAGRKEEIINRGGKKYFPREIEELPYEHPKIVQVAIVGAPDPRLGERNSVCVIVKSVVMTTVAAAALGMAAPATAQKMLNSYMTLSTAAAQQAAQAALARCQKDDFTVAVAVVDRTGQPLVMLRDPLAGAHTPQTAINKAATAVSFRTDTTELAATTQAGKPASGVRHLANVIAVGGGIVIRAKGSVVGGIGVSGAPGGDGDDVCAKAGIAAINDAIELE